MGQQRIAVETREERQQRVAEEKAAYEQRQQRRADAALRAKAKNTEAFSETSSVRSFVSSVPPSTASTASTTPAVPKRVAVLPDKCGFCGTKRVEQTKSKARVNSCKDRCHSCWRAF